MATQAQLQEKIDEASATVAENTDLLGSIEAAEEVQIQLIQDLRDRIANGEVVPDEMVAQLDTLTTTLRDNKARMAKLAVQGTPAAVSGNPRR